MTGPTVLTLEDIAIKIIVAVVLAALTWFLVRVQAYIAAHTTGKQCHNLADLALQICGAAEQQYRGRTSAGAEKFATADGRLHNALPKLTEAQRKTLIEDAVRAINAGVVTLAPYLASGAGAAGLAPLASFAAPLASIVAHGVADVGGVGGVGGLDMDALKADLLATVGPLAREAAAQAAPGALADAFARGVQAVQVSRPGTPGLTMPAAAPAATSATGPQTLQIVKPATGEVIAEVTADMTPTATVTPAAASASPAPTIAGQ
jgi:hypothetical protein